MIIGTAGHIDHGKTALVRALTGVDTDRLKEEKARGISIDLGFAYLPTPDGSVLGFVDVPGHEKFIHNMLAGATGIDFVLLVVAADDGVMPQTREHLAIVDLLGISRGVVALTKVDLVDASRRAEVADAIAQTLTPTGLAGAEIVAVSTITGEGIDDLRARLVSAAQTTDARSARGRFRLAVDRSFTLAGAGTVVTGTVLSGSVSAGDHVTVSPSGLAVRVRSIHAQNRLTERGVAGQRCALNLAGEGVSKDAIARGDVIVDPDLHAPTDRIDARLRLLPTEMKSIGQWTPARLHHAAMEVGARIVLLGEEPIAPGQEGRVQLVLERPTAAAVGDRFIVRDTTAQRTIGGGAFLDLRAPARRRRTPQRFAQLDACAIVDPERSLAMLLDCHPWVIDFTGFARDRAIVRDDALAMTTRIGAVTLVASGGAFALSAQTWARLRDALVTLLEKFHAANPEVLGMGIEALRRQAEPRLQADVFVAALQKFAADGELALDGAFVRLPKHSVRLAPGDEVLWRKIEPLLSGPERFRPPRVRDLAGLLGAREADVRRLLKVLGRMGRVDEIAGDHFFLRVTVAEIAEIVVDISAAASNGQFTAAQLRDRLDNGRKVAIQILEFFDRHGVTLRRGDLRRVNPQRLSLFRRPAASDASAGAADPTTHSGRESSLVGRPDFKSGRGRQTAFGGFDSLSLPPNSRRAR